MRLAPHLFRVFGCVSALICLAACGGGGSGGGSSGGGGSGGGGSGGGGSAAVIAATATASASSTQEGQTFTLDASGSTSTPTTTLAFAWTQVSGPTAVIDGAATAKPTVTVPEVAGDVGATFRVTVSGGGGSATASVDTTFANIVQTPTFLQLTLTGSATASLPIRSFAGTANGTVVGLASGASDVQSFSEVQPPPNMQVLASQSAFPIGFTPPGFVRPLRFPGLVSGAGQTQIVALQTDQNRLLVYRKIVASPTGGPLGYTAYVDQNVPSPCAVNQSFQNNGIGARYLYVGQRARGFTIFTVTADNTVTASLATAAQVNNGKSYCALSAVEQPILGNVFVDNSFHSLPDLIAIDTENNTIDQYVQETMTSYRLRSQTPIQLNSSRPLKFVAYADLATIFAQGLALVFSDGAHTGEHRVVIVGEDVDRNIVQETHAWPLGAPADVIVDNLDRDSFAEVIIISPDSPQAIVFESTAVAGVSRFPPLDPTPRYIEIGLGATAALPAASHDPSQPTLYLAYRDRRLLRLYTPP